MKRTSVGVELVWIRVVLVCVGDGVFRRGVEFVLIRERQVGIVVKRFARTSLLPGA